MNGAPASDVCKPGTSPQDTSNHQSSGEQTQESTTHVRKFEILIGLAVQKTSSVSVVYSS